MEFYVDIITHPCRVFSGPYEYLPFGVAGPQHGLGSSGPQVGALTVVLVVIARDVARAHAYLAMDTPMNSEIAPAGQGENSDLSNMAELPSFSPPASESTLQYRTSPPRQARMRPKLKAAPVYI